MKTTKNWKKKCVDGAMALAVILPMYAVLAWALARAIEKGA